MKIDFDLIRRDLVVETFRNFYSGEKRKLLVSPGHNLFLTIFITSTDLLEKSEEILKDSFLVY